MILLRSLIAAVLLAGLYFLVRGWMGSTAKEGPGDPTALQISLALRPAGETASASEGEPVIVRFQNVSAKPIRILKPIVGSEKGWNLPFYVLSMTSPLGMAVPLDGRSSPPAPGGTPKWPEDYVIEIPSGGSYETSIGFYRPLPTAGRYKLQFTYVFDPDKPGVLGSAVGMVYPKGLWIGTASSDIFPADLSGWYASQPLGGK